VSDYDAVVVGAGLAGATAALFAARHGHSTLVVDAGLVPGGQLFNIAKIEDFPGFPEGVAGYDLCPMLQEQATNAGAEFRPGRVDALEQVDGAWSVVVDGSPVSARSVVVATGSTPRKLDVPGEERLLGHGISHCASCDGPLYRERPVAVIGGGDSALLESLELASHVGEVTILVRSHSLRAQRTYVQRAEESPAIAFAFDTVVEEILGETNVTGIRTRNVATGETTEVEVAAVFPYVGSVPQTALLEPLVDLDADGRVPTDALMRTPRAGLLVAGEIRSGSAAQAVAVAGDGATAAVAAHRYLSDGAWLPVTDAAPASPTS
jgi:thioredoxin reductase (NADPH)